jgi:hypothetical protein
MESSEDVVLKDVRLDYHDIYQPGKPRSEKDQADPKKWKFKAKAIFEPGSEADVVAKAAMSSAALKLWGANAADMIRTMSKNNIALRDGNDYLDNNGAKRPNYVGMKFISASNNRDSKPLVVAPKKVDGNWVVIGEDGKGYINGSLLTNPPYEIIKPYRGCRVDLKVRFVAMKSDGKDMPNQIFAKLIAVLFRRDDEAFGGGGTNSAEGFDEVEVEGASSGGGASDADLFG